MTMPFTKNLTERGRRLFLDPTGKDSGDGTQVLDRY